MTASPAPPRQANVGDLLEYQSRLTFDENRAIVALAAEGRLAVSVLHEWGLSAETLQRSLEVGLLIADGSLRPRRLSQSVALETAYAVNASVRQMVLRRAQAHGLLLPALALAKETLKEKSRGEIVRRLQEGSLVPRQERGSRDHEMESQVMASILQPFDAIWLVRCWGERVPAVAEHVLSWGLRSMEDCGPLYHWFGEQSEFTLPSSLAAQLAAHALHRLEPAVAQRHWGALATSERLGLEAVARLQAGNVELARQLVEQSLRFSDKGRPHLHAWSPLLAFLQILPTDVAKTSGAPSWFSARNAGADHKDAARGLNRLIQELNPGDKVPRRLSAHQVSKDVTAWELLFLALSVDHSEKQVGPRASWSVRLCDAGKSWLDRGYLWMGRQALVLAARLDRDQVKAAGLLSDGLEPRPGDLAALLAPREPWEDALLALSRVSAEVSEATSEYRLEWYVNPHSGSVHQPALQSFQKGQGWSTLRRIDFSQARELASRLSTEDQKALAIVGEAKEFPHAEVLEALIAHPRVVDGTQGGTPLDVVRGECQLEAREEGDEITVEITPRRDLGLGLNILFDGATKLSVVMVPSVMHQVMQTLPRDLRVPKSQVARLREVLAPLAESISVKSAIFGAESPVSANSTPCLRVLPSAGAFLVEAGVRPFGSTGRFFVVGHGPLIISATQEGRRLRTERDFLKEQRRMAELMSACPSLGADHDPEGPGRATGESEQSWTFDRAGLVQLLAEVRDSSLACEWEWPVSSPQVLRGTLHSKSLRGVLRPQKGWYLLSGEVALDEVTYVSLAELSRMPKLARGRFVQLPSGDFLEVEKRLRRVLSGLSACSRVRGVPDQLKVSHAGLAALRALRDAPGFSFAAEASEALRVLDEVATAPLAAPSDLRAELRDYQLAGYSWLHKMGALGFGACLADDMGLGKTIQVLALLVVKPRGGRHLIVAPTSVCTNWVREIARFAPTLSAVEYLGAGRAERLHKGDEGENASSSQVVIVSYGLLHEDIEQLGQEVWDTVVLDEAQYIKNPHSLRAQAAFLLKGHQRIALSGTPIENHLGDLWSLFHFLNPELLGSWRNFETHFAKPIQRDKDSIRQETLREIARPFLLRRTKRQVLKELPPLSTIRREIILEKEDALRYGLLRKQIHNKLYQSAVKRHSKLEVLAEITRLRRFCCHPQLVFPEAPQQSAKVEALIELVEELRQNGHRALVFSQYVDFLHLVMNRLAEQHISYLSFDGSTPKAARQNVIDRFQAGEASLFLISLKAGGLGINLTAADYVIHLDPWWNPAVASQATDRAHRIGQERPVTVYEFVTRDTIEEDILVLHTHKRNLADALLEGGEQVAQLSTDELKEWFQHSLGSEWAN